MRTIFPVVLLLLFFSPTHAQSKKRIKTCEIYHCADSRCDSSQLILIEKQEYDRSGNLLVSIYHSDTLNEFFSMQIPGARTRRFRDVNARFVLMVNEPAQQDSTWIYETIVCDKIGRVVMQKDSTPTAVKTDKYVYDDQNREARDETIIAVTDSTGHSLYPADTSVEKTVYGKYGEVWRISTGKTENGSYINKLGKFSDEEMIVTANDTVYKLRVRDSVVEHRYADSLVREHFVGNESWMKLREHAVYDKNDSLIRQQIYDPMEGNVLAIDKRITRNSWGKKVKEICRQTDFMKQSEMPYPDSIHYVSDRVTVSFIGTSIDTSFYDKGGKFVRSVNTDGNSRFELVRTQRKTRQEDIYVEKWYQSGVLEYFGVERISYY